MGNKKRCTGNDAVVQCAAAILKFKEIEVLLFVFACASHNLPIFLSLLTGSDFQSRRLIRCIFKTARTRQLTDS